MTLDDESLNGSYTVMENKLPKGKIKKISLTESKVRKLLADGKAHTLTGILDEDPTISSIGNLHGVIKKGLREKWIKEDKCCECRQSTVYRLDKKKLK